MTKRYLAVRRLRLPPRWDYNRFLVHLWDDVFGDSPDPINFTLEGVCPVR